MPPEYKRCRACETDLPLAMFGPRRAKCNDCKRAQGRAYYQRTKRSEQYYATKRAQYAAARATLDALKARPCTDCGGSFPPCAMEFDHRTPTLNAKRFRISSFVAARHIPGMLAESEKCDLVCANCHRIRTDNQRKAGLFPKGGRPRTTSS